jgi:hypothetical protein
MRVELGAGLAVLLALSACGKSGDHDRQQAGPDRAETIPSSTGPMPGAKGVSVRLNPGEWEMTVESAGMSATGMPPEVARMMKGMKVTTRSCITPEEANRPNVFAGKAGGNCSYRDYKVSGGTLHAAILCTDKGGGSTKVTSDGSIGGDSFDVRSRIETDAGGHAMNMDSHVIGRRVGECSGAGS